MSSRSTFVNSPFRKELFQRDWRIRIGVPFTTQDGVRKISGLDVSDLDCEFEITKDLTSEPNMCSLTVYNLRPEVRAALEQQNIYDPKRKKTDTTSTTTTSQDAATKLNTKSKKRPVTGNIRVEIEAGYKETSRALIFSGDLRRALSSEDRNKSVATKIEGGDGGYTFNASRVSESFPKGTSKLSVVKSLLGALGLGQGNLLEVEHILAASSFRTGTVIDGSASRELAGILRSAKLSYSIQDGAVQFLVTGQGLRRKGVALNPGSGLIGTPERDVDGKVKVVSLMNPSLAVGLFVFLESEDLKGTFRIDKIVYRGQTTGEAWFCEMELRSA